MTLSMSAYAADFYVSPDGDDSNAGTKEKPFRTLLKARDETRRVKVDAGETKTVTITAGRYRLTDTFELDERDAYTIYQASTGQDVRITGGVEVPVTDLKPVTENEVLDRLPKDVRSKVVNLVLPGKGPGDSSTWPLRFRGYAGWPEIYVDGNALRLARWPNTGYAKIAEVLDRGSRPRHNEKPDRGGLFKYAEDNPSRWSLDQPVYLGGYWCFKWYDEFVRVKSIDVAKKEVQMAAPHQYGLVGPSKGLYYAINLLEELDQPGEYVYDGNHNVLYVLLPADATNVLHVSMLKKPLVRIKNATDISFRGIIFENGCDVGIVMSDCESVCLADCTIRQISGTGVDIKGGKECGVDRSRLTTIGKTAISLTGGNRKTLVPSKHFVTHCRISHFARLIKTYCPAVSLGGVGQIVSNNHLHDAPHCAILFGGNDHQITHNHIERVCLDTSDAGAIYCGRDWTLGGNRIHGNFIHDLGKATHHQNWAIYLDDMAAGIEVSKNVVIDTDAGFLIGGGRSNVITDNLIKNCSKNSIVFDARATGWAGSHVKKPSGTLWVRLNAMPFTSDIWRKRFPYLEKIKGDVHQEPRRNTLTGNLLFSTPTMRLDERVTEHGTVRDNVQSQSMPTIQLKNGKLITSDANLNAYDAMIIGPSVR